MRRGQRVHLAADPTATGTVVRTEFDDILVFLDDLHAEESLVWFVEHQLAELEDGL